MWFTESFFHLGSSMVASFWGIGRICQLLAKRYSRMCRAESEWIAEDPDEARQSFVHHAAWRSIRNSLTILHCLAGSIVERLVASTIACSQKLYHGVRGITQTAMAFLLWKDTEAGALNNRALSFIYGNTKSTATFENIMDNALKSATASGRALDADTFCDIVNEQSKRTDSSLGEHDVKQTLIGSTIVVNGTSILVDDRIGESIDDVIAHHIRTTNHNITDWRNADNVAHAELDSADVSVMWHKTDEHGKVVLKFGTCPADKIRDFVSASKTINVTSTLHNNRVYEGTCTIVSQGITDDVASDITVWKTHEFDPQWTSEGTCESVTDISWQTAQGRAPSATANWLGGLGISRHIIATVNRMGNFVVNLFELLLLVRDVIGIGKSWFVDDDDSKNAVPLDSISFFPSKFAVMLNDRENQPGVLRRMMQWFVAGILKSFVFQFAAGKIGTMMCNAFEAVAIPAAMEEFNLDGMVLGGSTLAFLLQQVSSFTESSLLWKVLPGLMLPVIRAAAGHMPLVGNLSQPLVTFLGFLLPIMQSGSQMHVATRVLALTAPYLLMLYELATSVVLFVDPTIPKNAMATLQAADNACSKVQLTSSQLSRMQALFPPGISGQVNVDLMEQHTKLAKAIMRALAQWVFSTTGLLQRTLLPNDANVTKVPLPGPPATAITDNIKFIDAMCKPLLQEADVLLGVQRQTLFPKSYANIYEIVHHRTFRASRAIDPSVIALYMTAHVLGAAPYAYNARRYPCYIAAMVASSFAYIVREPITDHMIQQYETLVQGLVPNYRDDQFRNYLEYLLTPRDDDDVSVVATARALQDKWGAMLRDGDIHTFKRNFFGDPRAVDFLVTERLQAPFDARRLRGMVTRSTGPLYATLQIIRAMGPNTLSMVNPAIRALYNTKGGVYRALQTFISHGPDFTRENNLHLTILMCPT